MGISVAPERGRPFCYVTTSKTWLSYLRLTKQLAQIGLTCRGFILSSKETQTQFVCGQLSRNTQLITPEVGFTSMSVQNM